MLFKKSWVSQDFGGISRDTTVTNYTLGKTLKDADSFKDLGVTTKDLSWGNHISMTVNKANKVL